MKLKLTKEPIISVAQATATPETFGSLTWCYQVNVKARVLLK